MESLVSSLQETMWTWCVGNKWCLSLSKMVKAFKTKQMELWWKHWFQILCTDVGLNFIRSVSSLWEQNASVYPNNTARLWNFSVTLTLTRSSSLLTNFCTRSVSRRWISDAHMAKAGRKTRCATCDTLSDGSRSDMFSKSAPYKQPLCSFDTFLGVRLHFSVLRLRKYRGLTETLWKTPPPPQPQPAKTVTSTTIPQEWRLRKLNWYLRGLYAESAHLFPELWPNEAAALPAGTCRVRRWRPWAARDCARQTRAPPPSCRRPASASASTAPTNCVSHSANRRQTKMHHFPGIPVWYFLWQFFQFRDEGRVLSEFSCLLCYITEKAPKTLPFSA